MPAKGSSNTHVYPGITLETVNSLRGQAGGGNLTLNLDPDGTGGLLTIPVPVGDVVLRFDHNKERSELTLTIVKKPIFLSAALIFQQASHILNQAASHAASGSGAEPAGGA
jgi:hypothetical protein